MYTDFAYVYDLLMQDVDYRTWADRYISLLPPGTKRVTECACGTGAITVFLAQRGLRVTGLDLSESMLQLAMEKSRNMGLIIPYVRQDMRFLSVPRPQDAVLATCDGVNYLLTEADALAFFTSARAALKDGGRLLFDISSEYKLQNILGSNTLTLDEEDAAYIWQNTWDDKTRTVQMDLTIFVRQKENGFFRRLQESQVQRAWSTDELGEMLTRAGFADIRFFGGMTDMPPALAEQRIFICAGC